MMERLLQEGGAVVGIDRSEGALAKARENAEREGVHNVRFECASSLIRTRTQFLRRYRRSARVDVRLATELANDGTLIGDMTFSIRARKPGATPA